MAEIVAASPILTLWLLLLVFFRVYRVWLPFYVLGAVGLATLIIYFGRGAIPIELWLKELTGLNVHQIASLFGVQTKLFDGVPGSLMVLVVAQPIGWTVVHIDIECSAMLESAVFVGLIAFYPGWSLGKKLGLAAIGLTATYVANLIRILAIVTILHWGGKDTLFMTHTIIARGLFFTAVVLIYWYLITRPTIGTVRENLRRGTPS